MQDAITADPIESIPDPRIVRERLGKALRDVQVLRRLLRVAEHAEQARELDRETEQECAVAPA